MARGFNRSIIMGNLARDPDVRFTPNKLKVARITVAVGRQWKNKNSGELQSQVDFIPVVLWGSQADIVEKYLRKGRPVLVEGRISVRDFEDAKTGQRRWVTEVVAENIVLLSSGRREDGDSGYSNNRYESSNSRYENPAPQSRSYNDANRGFSGGDMGSLREESGFDEDFPLDFSEAGSGKGGEESGDVDIPF